MSKRYAASADKLEVLIDFMEQEGILPPEWAAAMHDAGDEPARAREMKYAHREGRGPPEWAGPPDHE